MKKLRVVLLLLLVSLIQAVSVNSLKANFDKSLEYSLLESEQNGMVCDLVKAHGLIAKVEYFPDKAVLTFKDGHEEIIPIIIFGIALTAAEVGWISAGLVATYAVFRFHDITSADYLVAQASWDDVFDHNGHWKQVPIADLDLPGDLDDSFDSGTAGGSPGPSGGGSPEPSGGGSPGPSGGGSALRKVVKYSFLIEGTRRFFEYEIHYSKKNEGVAEYDLGQHVVLPDGATLEQAAAVTALLDGGLAVGYTEIDGTKYETRFTILEDGSMYFWSSYDNNPRRVSRDKDGEWVSTSLESVPEILKVSQLKKNTGWYKGQEVDEGDITCKDDETEAMCLCRVILCSPRDTSFVWTKEHQTIAIRAMRETEHSSKGVAMYRTFFRITRHLASGLGTSLLQVYSQKADNVGYRNDLVRFEGYFTEPVLGDYYRRNNRKMVLGLMRKEGFVNSRTTGGGMTFLDENYIEGINLFEIMSVENNRLRDFFWDMNIPGFTQNFGVRSQEWLFYVALEDLGMFGVVDPTFYMEPAYSYDSVRIPQIDFSEHLEISEGVARLLYSAENFLPYYLDHEDGGDLEYVPGVTSKVLALEFSNEFLEAYKYKLKKYAEVLFVDVTSPGKSREEYGKILHIVREIENLQNLIDSRLNRIANSYGYYMTAMPLVWNGPYMRLYSSEWAGKTGFKFPGKFKASKRLADFSSDYYSSLGEGARCLEDLTLLEIGNEPPYDQAFKLEIFKILKGLQIDRAAMERLVNFD
jgi:hypothetical protein